MGYGGGGGGGGGEVAEHGTPAVQVQEEVIIQ